ncbi:MAG: hypothetical protein ACTIJ9_09375 [Aequorivita sp.]
MASLIFTVLLIVLQSGSETSGPPAPGPGGGDGTENPQLPIDDNIWILLVVGVFFGIYILYKRNKAISRVS